MGASMKLGGLANGPCNRVTIFGAFLDECELEPFKRKIECYLENLQDIANREVGLRAKTAQQLIDKYKLAKTSHEAGVSGASANFEFVRRSRLRVDPTGLGEIEWGDFEGSQPDRQLARMWEKEHLKSANKSDESQIHYHQPTFTGPVLGSTLHTTHCNIVTKTFLCSQIKETGHSTPRIPSGASLKRTHTDLESDDGNYQTGTRPPMVNDNEIQEEESDNENENDKSEDPAVELGLSDTLEEQQKEEEEEQGLIMLEINGINVRSRMEHWRKTSIYVPEIHKQDLLRYNIIDAIRTSTTEAQTLFKEIWNDMIGSMEMALQSGSEIIQYEDSENGLAGNKTLYEQYFQKYCE
ncbi:hypothetical protein BC938DRAFT_481823 [Jimgerdemannia flammicorona]|uniref:Uncharacterized protein n=1 Tax=Jimgerdemannia flammicorona TaxID=994334 RepID=A0A433QFA9_9FUNG|nr:hypothetical protein BC938DRAFT_481823 [Jimgerdemannia flammicorona]